MKNLTLIKALMTVALARIGRDDRAVDYALQELSKELCREGYCTHRCSGQG